MDEHGLRAKLWRLAAVALPQSLRPLASASRGFVRGIAELEEHRLSLEPGPPLTEVDPTLLDDLDGLAEPVTRGDPEPPVGRAPCDIIAIWRVSLLLATAGLTVAILAFPAKADALGPVDIEIGARAGVAVPGTFGPLGFGIGGRGGVSFRDVRCSLDRVPAVTLEARTREQALETVQRRVTTPGEPGAAYHWQPSRGRCRFVLPFVNR